jgi:hypothetical protein
VSRYVAITVVDDGMWWDKGPLLAGIQAHDLNAHDTGLLDGRGRKIMRQPDPVGFHRPSGVSEPSDRGIDRRA